MPHIARTNPAANSATTRAFVQWIRSAAPYIHAFRGKTFVIGNLPLLGNTPLFALDPVSAAGANLWTKGYNAALVVVSMSRLVTELSSPNA